VRRRKGRAKRRRWINGSGRGGEGRESRKEGKVEAMRGYSREEE
jgi:hypothetical protein